MNKYTVLTSKGTQHVKADGYRISEDGYLAFYNYIIRKLKPAGTKMIRGFKNHISIELK
jgi:hypothetical protein